MSRLFHDLERLIWIEIDNSMELSEQRDGCKGNPKVTHHSLEYIKTIALMSISESLQSISESLKGIKRGEQ